MWTHSRRTGAVVASILLVLAMAIAGCGGAAQTNTSGQPKTGGTLTVVPSPYGSFTRNFNPYSSSVNSGTQGMIYETLLYFNREKAGSVQPWLASAYNWSSDGKTLTFTMRNGVKWSDGQPLTSADVVFTLNYLHQNPGIDTFSLWSVISSVSAPDPHTVTVNFSTTAFTYLWYLAGQTYILPQHLWSSVTDPVTYTDPNPVGTGPFTLKSFDPQLYVFAKNPSYWQPGKPYIDTVRYPAYTSNTSADLLLSQASVDWTGVFSPNLEKTFVQRDPTHDKYWFPPSNDVMLYTNDAKAPFNNVAVRQAISDAIDRTQLSKVGEDGYEQVASPTALVLPNEQPFLAPQYASTQFTVDTAKAEQLLQGAGYTKGSDGIYQDSSGHKLAFNLNVVTGWTDWVTDCQIMADELKKIGIQVTVNAVSYGAYIAALNNGQFDMAISWTSPGPTPFYLLYNMLDSKLSAPIGQKAISNWERWMDPTTDSLLQQYANTNDKTAQDQAIYGLQKIMVEQLPAIPLVYGATWYEYNTSQFTGFPDANNPYAGPAPWQYPDVEVVAMNIHK